MLRVYSILGGGSTYVCVALRNKFNSRNVFCRIDKFFLAPDESQVMDDSSFVNIKKARKYKQHQVLANFEECPQQTVIDAIKRRTGFTMSPTVSVNKNLSTLIRENPKKHFLFVRASEFGFLSANQIRSIAVVRHPLLGYVGLCNPNRHPEFVAPYGLQSEEKVRWFAGLWNRSVSDFIKANSVILRYEFLQEDLKKSSVKDVDASIFDGWKPSKRPSNLREDLEELMLKLVKEQYSKIYGDWQIPHEYYSNNGAIPS